MTTKSSLFYAWSALMEGAFGDAAPLLIAYTIGATHRASLFDTGFPLLNIEGQRAAGKTAAGWAVVRALGNPANDAGFCAESASAKTFDAMLHQNQGLALLVDECRPGISPAIVSRLKSFYDFRQWIPRSTTIRPKLPQVPLGTVICSQDRIADPALRSRCVIVQLDASTRRPNSASKLQRLREFEQANHGWLQPDPLMGQPLQTRVDSNRRYLQDVAEHMGWQAEARQLYNLSILLTAMESWAELGYHMVFGPDDLTTAFWRHNQPYATHQGR